MHNEGKQRKYRQQQNTRKIPHSFAGEGEFYLGMDSEHLTKII